MSRHAESQEEARRRANRWILGGSALLVIGATLGHYLTPTSSPQFHDALRRLYYLPIALVGVRCGMRAGLAIASFVVVAYFPHIFLQWGGDPFGPVNLNRSFEMVLWLIVGLLAVIALVVGRRLVRSARGSAP